MASDFTSERIASTTSGSVSLRSLIRPSPSNFAQPSPCVSGYITRQGYCFRIDASASTAGATELPPAPCRQSTSGYFLLASGDCGASQRYVSSLPSAPLKDFHSIESASTL